jgi:cephalosporin-C deacetylase
MRKSLLPVAPIACALVVANWCCAQPIRIEPDRTNGVYQIGDTVHWTVEWKGGTNAPVARYTLKSGGLTNVGQGNLNFTDNVATLESKFDAPNTMLVEVAWQPDNNFNRAWGGAVAAPEKIKPAAPPPDDFDVFWEAKIQGLKRVPANPQLEKVDIDKTNIAYWKITLDNIRGAHIQGQIASPEKGEKFPALLILQYAGVYALQKNWVTDRAAEGWLALDIEAHDLPIDQPNSFYKEQYAGPLKNYWNIGNDAADKSYYLRMYLSCYQALEYLKTRPDWNGKALVVTGQSQGGQQTLMLAGLHPEDITAAMVLVPAACDMLAPEAGRAPGFPGWYFNTAGRDPKKVHEASRYYDPANFARHIKCPVLIGIGLHDEVLAPPSSIFATANEITSSKEVITLSKSGHQNEHGSLDPYNQRCYKVWLPALRQGKPAPVEQSN